MKTLVNKRNPQIRITAPEIEIDSLEDYYRIPGVALLSNKVWELVEEEPKHTEVWVEGRTIFEQEGEPEVDLEKAAEEYIEKRASLAPNESWDIEDMRAAVRFGAEWQKKQRNKELRKKIDEYWNAGYEAGVEWQKQRDKEWMEAKEKEFKDIRDTTRWVNRDLGYNNGFDAGVERAFKQFSDILDKWEEHAIMGMKVGEYAYNRGKIALICDLRDWIKEQTKK